MYGAGERREVKMRRIERMRVGLCVCSPCKIYAHECAQKVCVRVRCSGIIDLLKVQCVCAELEEQAQGFELVKYSHSYGS